MNTKQMGKLGEDIACSYLKNKGYKILQRNFEMKTSRFLKSEIDIIAKKDNTIHFVEIKCQRQKSQEPFLAFSPEQKVDFKKKRKISKTAELWLFKNKIPLDAPAQIDIIAITINSFSEKIKIKHFENI